MNFVALDFETANHRRDSVCEIGIAVVAEGAISESRSWLVRPRQNWFHAMNTRIHGIDANRVAHEPEFDSVWEEAKRYFENANLVAHNASFDMGVLRYVLAQYDLAPPLITYSCSLAVARRAWKGLPSYGLKALAKHFNIPLNHHSAEPDAIASALIMLRALEEHQVEQFSDISNVFGLHLGKLSSEQPGRLPHQFANGAPSDAQHQTFLMPATVVGKPAGNQLSLQMPIRKLIMLDKKVRGNYKVVVGLEVHIQLSTQSKIFSADATTYGSPPNTNISAITLGHPGTLPKLNKQVIEYAIKMGLACRCAIVRRTIFDRKNYFYPDLPKGYQIMQDKTPICQGGEIPIKTLEGERKIKLHHIHMEEDAGKSMHLEHEPETLVDLNRAGVALIELVTEPDIHSSEEAYAMLTEIRKMVRYLDICDGNMEEGSMRCDANVSVMLNEATELGKKVEVKNMNSIRNVQRAIEYEVERQITKLENGEAIVSETRTFDAAQGTTTSMRTKEDLNDYRYFPEPDLSPLEVSDAWLADIRASMPTLPYEYRRKFVKDYQLPDYDAEVLTDTKQSARYFEKLCQHTHHYKAASNWMMGPVRSYLNETSYTIEGFLIPPKSMAALIDLVAQGTISFAVASQHLFPALLAEPQRPVKQMAEALNLLQDSNVSNLQPLIEDILHTFPDKVIAYQGGKKGLLGMFMGELMKRSHGKANPKLANELLRKALEGAP